MNPRNLGARGLARMLGFKTLNYSPEHKMFLAAERGHQRFGGIDLDPGAMECLAIWWALHKKEPLVIVAATAQKGADFIEGCRQRLAACESVGMHVWVGVNNEGLCSAHSNDASVVHMRPQVLDRADIARKAALILVPDLDDVPGCFLTSMCALPEPEKRLLLVNAAR